MILFHLLSATPVQPIAIISCLITILILLACSGLISASEVAFFSLGPNEKADLKLDDSKNAKDAILLIEKPQDLLAIILIANNFVNVGVVIISSFLLNIFFPSEAGNGLLRFLIDVVLITTVILLAGEVIPKVYATKNGLPIVKFMARPLSMLGSLPPLSLLKIFLVNGTSIIHKYAKKRKVNVTSDEFEQILALTKNEHTSEDEHKLLEGIVKFGNKDVKQVMKPRMEMAAIDNSTDYLKLLDFVKEHGYSRIPVYSETIDNVTGILYSKDLLPYLDETINFEWTKLVRNPFFVPENKKLDDLLNEFQSKKMHMAIVVDEYGGAAGLITLEDILEEIVGDITDEFDEKDLQFTQTSETTFIFEGKTSLIDFYKVLDIDGKEFENNKGESDTLSGFLVEQAGRILKNKEIITFESIKFIVLSSDKKRIRSIRIEIEPLNSESQLS